MLGDEGKRKQYDTFGMGGEQASATGQGYNQAKGYQYYQSQVDPEELFRTIFGDAFRQGRNFETIFDNFGAGGQEETQFEPSQVKLNSF